MSADRLIGAIANLFCLVSGEYVGIGISYRQFRRDQSLDGISKSQIGNKIKMEK